MENKIIHTQSNCVQSNADNTFAWMMDLALAKGYNYIAEVATSPSKFLKIEDLKILDQAELVTQVTDWSGRFHRQIYQLENALLYVLTALPQVKEIKVATASSQFTQEIVKSIKDKFVEIEIVDRSTYVRFWYCGSEGPDSINVKLETPSWEDIKTNYPQKIIGDLDRLMKYRPNDKNIGKLLLFHGVPGTGKTWYLRCLLEEWKKWCYYSFIIDIDKLFSAGGAEYLIHVFGLGQEYVKDDEEEYNQAPAPRIFGHEQPATDATSMSRQKYNLVILEDSGELLAKDAKNQVGQALSRVLNISDGLLGQGNKSLIMISTNDQLSDLHEAITRPGRCLANIEFPMFHIEEAKEWLRSKNIDEDGIKSVDGNTTLAKMYEIVNSSMISNKVQKVIGFRGHD